MTLHVSGASDDLIEVGGSVYDEFDAYYDSPTVVLVLARADTSQAPTVVILEVEYSPDDSGEWRIRVVKDNFNLVTVIPARGEEAGDDEDGVVGYSDKAVVRGGFSAEIRKDGAA